ncbi:MAG: MBL fold hydrolase [Candidatus Sericytochromatia bacterium]|nr:MAG: MBL fold hydrolase [Candidatus Sericytochromatia bacterium]
MNNFSLIETIVVGAFQCNCTIIADNDTKEAIIIDPGDEANKILEIVKYYNLNVKYLMHTHAHLDHIMATREIKEKTNAKIVLHKDDNEIYNNLKFQAQMFGFNAEVPLPVDIFVKENDEIKIGNKIISKIIHTPGHSPGSICFYFDKENNPVIFSGDTLFSRSIGRTDLWGGSYSTIINSIKNKIFNLREDTIVYPGHGPKTTIWSEKKYNPFF